MRNLLVKQETLLRDRSFLSRGFNSTQLWYARGGRSLVPGGGDKGGRSGEIPVIDAAVVGDERN